MNMAKVQGRRLEANGQEESSIQSRRQELEN